jgi:hypothetical protein
MQFDLDRTIEILTATPNVLYAMLSGLSSEWTDGSDPDDWQPNDILGHLIHGEKTDWMPRVRQILSDGQNRDFDPFDRFAQFENSKGKSVKELLDEFWTSRLQSLDELRLLELTTADLELKGLHPAFGEVVVGEGE